MPCLPWRTLAARWVRAPAPQIQPAPVPIDEALGLLASSAAQLRPERASREISAPRSAVTWQHIMPQVHPLWPTLHFAIALFLSLLFGPLAGLFVLVVE